MSTETILTDEEIITLGQQARAIESGGNGYILPVTFARAIEQAVLQSEQVQAWKRDTERYRHIKKGNQWIVAATQTGAQIDGEDLDDLIDSEMEQQK